MEVPPWDTGPFESDEAYDDLHDLEEADDMATALHGLMSGLDAEAHLYLGDVEGPVAAACLVACRVAGLTPDEEWAVEWLKRNPFLADATLRRLASSVLDIAMRPDDNDLYDSWRTPEARERWLQDLDVYRGALALHTSGAGARSDSATAVRHRRSPDRTN
ncbi:DUF4259 domain-containing protein [Nonomuraea sp. NPDC059023]|uniref:DUF4259 domain-containing protein n=1 Tax=unclassified Nonomuraea TaxID=2593643 RepID=UPI0036AE3C8E